MTPFRRAVAASRRFRVCEAAPCREPRSGIEVGSPYVRLTLPPRAEMNDGEHFWSLVLHPGCAGAVR